MFVDRRHEPWGVRVSNGERCQSLTGGLDSINLKPVTYRCDGGGFLLGRVRPRSVTVDYLALSQLPPGMHSKRVKRVQITDEWR